MDIIHCTFYHKIITRGEFNNLPQSRRAAILQSVQCSDQAAKEIPLNMGKHITGAQQNSSAEERKTEGEEQRR